MSDFLVTYRDGANWNFNWFENEEELREWLEEYKEEYSSIEAIEVNHIRTIYSSDKL